MRITRLGLLLVSFAVSHSIADVTWPSQGVKACGMDYRDNPTPRTYVVLLDGATFSKSFNQDVITELNVANSVYSSCLTAYSTGQPVQIISSNSTSFNINAIQVGN